MLITIVARTRRGRAACIGGITADGRSVRLIAPDAAFNEYHNLDYRVGEVWEIEGEAPDELIAPHVENIVVRRKRRAGRADALPDLIERHMPSRAGGLEVLYDGLTQGQPGGPLFITERAGIPTHSTMFWRPDQTLVRDTTGKRIRYRYPTDDGGRTITFTGFQDPPETLPAGTLLRVSLAHWWRPEEHPEAELRCYLQLSGWFLPDHPQVDEEYEDEAPEPEFDDEMRSGPSLAEARLMLRRVFGYDDFRPHQAEIIRNVLDRRDSLAVMPTGSGKSMCFQLPALLFPGLTVVVSPLISLMEDQVMQLRQSGVAASFLNSTLGYDGHIAIMQQIRAGHIKLLYTSPETLLRPETLLMLDDCRVDCLTIDEAHCISEWGHDFRPEYRQLVQVRRRLSDAVCLALTATATERVRHDIKQTLAVADADEFVSSFDRENLFLAVAPREGGLAQIETFLENRRGESGLIYCATRERTEVVAAQLAARGWNALPYHAGMDYATRRENQRRFAHEEGIIVVATIAFGMGINKSNVRFVIHHDLPKDLENYYQQIGRAGRDGLPADCLLLFSRQDVMTISFLLDQGDPAQRPAAVARLQAMIAFAETSDCRRRPLLAYFGENDIPETCGRCDNCLAGERERVDLTVPAQKFLSCVARTEQFFGASHIIDILRGSKSKEVLRRGHDRLSTYDIGGEFTKKEWQQLARQFVSDGLLIQDMDHGSLKLTPKGRAVLKGEPYLGTPPAAEPDRRPRHATEQPRDYDAELFERLRRLRLELATEAGLPPYVIFSDAALRDMAIYYPHTPDSFIRMQGVGAVKLERYGDAFLAVIRAYCEERGIGERPKPDAPARAAESRPLKPRGPVASRAPTRRDEVLALFRREYGLDDIAEMFGVKRQTVAAHLWESLLLGEKIDTRSIMEASGLTAQEQERIYAVFDNIGTSQLRPAFDALEESVPYEVLHLSRLHYVAQMSAGNRVDAKELLARVVAFGDAGDSARWPELVGLLQHPDGNVRRLSASALGKLGDTRAVDALVALLVREEKPQVRQYAVKALGLIGEPDARMVLEQIRDDEGEMDYTRKAAEDALRNIRGN